MDLGLVYENHLERATAISNMQRRYPSIRKTQNNKWRTTVPLLATTAVAVPLGMKIYSEYDKQRLEAQAAAEQAEADAAKAREAAMIADLHIQSLMRYPNDALKAGIRDVCEAFGIAREENQQKFRDNPTHELVVWRRLFDVMLQIPTVNTQQPLDIRFFVFGGTETCQSILASLEEFINSLEQAAQDMIFEHMGTFQAAEATIMRITIARCRRSNAMMEEAMADKALFAPSWKVDPLSPLGGQMHVFATTSPWVRVHDRIWAWDDPTIAGESHQEVK